jgi:hypothetical protein
MAGLTREESNLTWLSNDLWLLGAVSAFLDAKLNPLVLSK